MTLWEFYDSIVLCLQEIWVVKFCVALFNNLKSGPKFNHWHAKEKKIAFKRWVWLPSFKNHSDIRWWWFSRNPGAQGCFTAAALLIQPTSDYVPWSLLTCLCLEPGQRNSRACCCLLAKRMQSSALIYFHHLWFKYFRNTQVFKTAKWIITTVYCMG